MTDRVRTSFFWLRPRFFFSGSSNREERLAQKKKKSTLRFHHLSLTYKLYMYTFTYVINMWKKIPSNCDTQLRRHAECKYWFSTRNIRYIRTRTTHVHTNRDTHTLFFFFFKSTITYFTQTHWAPPPLPSYLGHIHVHTHVQTHWIRATCGRRLTLQDQAADPLHMEDHCCRARKNRSVSWHKVKRLSVITRCLHVVTKYSRVYFHQYKLSRLQSETFCFCMLYRDMLHITTQIAYCYNQKNVFL